MLATNTKHMRNVGEPIVFITENWTGQQHLCPKFFICMSMTFVITENWTGRKLLHPKFYMHVNDIFITVTWIG